MGLKIYTEKDVLIASKERISYIFDNFNNIYISFSAGKDSSVMMHLVLKEAIKRNRKIGVLIIDLEAQYEKTIQHAEDMVKEYKKNIDLYWVCLPIKLRNAVSTFEPTWIAWELGNDENWVRQPHELAITDINYFDFFEPNMEFEEFMVLFGVWYAKNENTCAFVGIRTDESLNRFRTIASKKKETYGSKNWTTKVADSLYNAYPIYDWKVKDLWLFHSKNPHMHHNEIYDMMYKAGMTPNQMRLCQPYGDDQRKGLWLFHMLEPKTWYKVVSRVNGVNSGSLYINETGNINGYNKISKPANHTWESFCNMLLSTMPEVTRNHYVPIFSKWIINWKKRGYRDGIPDEAPLSLENKKWAPSWRRLCKVLLRNDWWCKGLGLSQPKSEAYGKYLEIKKQKKQST